MFGGPGTTGNSGFGQSADQNSSNQNNANQADQAKSTFSFGGFKTSSLSSTPAFGTNNPSQGTPSNTGAGLFGAQPDTAAKPSGFSFGAQNTMNQQSGFGVGASPATTSAASTSGTQPLLFGNTAAPTASTTPSLFSSASTTKPTAAFGLAPAQTAAPLFGSAPTQATSAPAVPTSNLFGAAASTAESAPKSNLFGSTTTTTAPTSNLFGSKSTTPASSLGLGGSTAPTAVATNTLGGTTPSAAKPPLFGTPATTGQTPAAPATSSLFGTQGTTPADKPSTTIESAKTTAPTSLFGATTAPLKVDDLGKPTAEGATLAKTSVSVGALASAKPTSSLATAPATGNISVLKNKSVEDILYKWSTELDNYTREFQKQAIQIQKWDEAIVSNGALVTQLFNELQDVEACEKEIDQNLEYIEAQQNELELALETYSSQIQAIVSQDQANPNSRFRSTPADEDREKAFVLAEHLNTKLDDMVSSLSIVINELNTARKKSDTNTSSISGIDESPLESITQILNAHLTSLEWIERSSSKLELKVEKLKGLEKQVSGKILNR